MTISYLEANIPQNILSLFVSRSEKVVLCVKSIWLKNKKNKIKNFISSMAADDVNYCQLRFWLK